MKQSIIHKPVREISGAASFLALLNSMNNVVVSLATGGWYESAILKLKSAGIDFSSITFASSNDHFSRTEIMKISAYKTAGDKKYPCTYFGDGSWDKEACEKLGYNFVLVGNKLNHKPCIENYESIHEVLACIDL